MSLLTGSIPPPPPHTVRVENFEVVLISCFSWVADDTKIIHVEGGINTRVARNFPPSKISTRTVILENLHGQK